MSKLKNLTAALIAFVVLSATANAATIDSTGVSFPAEEPFSVKYLGNDGEYLLFEVVMKSNDTKHTSLAVSDTEAGELYSSPIRSSYKVQTMKIEKTTDQQLNFKLVVGTNVYNKSFSILSPVALETAKVN